MNLGVSQDAFTLGHDSEKRPLHPRPIGHWPRAIGHFSPTTLAFIAELVKPSTYIYIYMYIYVYTHGCVIFQGTPCLVVLKGSQQGHLKEDTPI